MHFILLHFVAFQHVCVCVCVYIYIYIYMYIKTVYTSIIFLIFIVLLPMTGCKTGYFGWKCRFRCNCKEGVSCDPINGDCPTGCQDDSWGPGCILSNWITNEIIYTQKCAFKNFVLIYIRITILSNISPSWYDQQHVFIQSKTEQVKWC